MYKAFGIVSSSGRNIYVDGMQDYRPIGAFSFLGRYRPTATLTVFRSISIINPVLL